MISEKEYSVGGSVFWILLIGIAITTLFFLLLWSFHNNSLKGVVISIIFLLMILASIIFSRFKVFDLSTWGDNTLSFTLGFLIWAFIGSFFGGQSIISVQKNSLFATVASELPQIMEFTTNALLIPIAEEMFWMIGIPLTIIGLFNIIGRRVSLFKNFVFQLIVTIIVSAGTFAAFHVGKLFVSFLVAAIVFRTLMILLVFGDQQYDIIKKVNLVVGFSVGAHMANNISVYGFGNAWTLIVSNFFPAGLLILAFFGLFFFSGFERLLRLLGRGVAS